MTPGVMRVEAERIAAELARVEESLRLLLDHEWPPLTRLEFNVVDSHLGAAALKTDRIEHLMGKVLARLTLLSERMVHSEHERIRQQETLDLSQSPEEPKP